jgi:hypothetical protein
MYEADKAFLSKLRDFPSERKVMSLSETSELATLFKTYYSAPRRLTFLTFRKVSL